MTRPLESSARQTAVYFRLGTPRSTRNFRHCSGSGLARRLRGAEREPILLRLAALHLGRSIDLINRHRTRPDPRAVVEVELIEHADPVAHAGDADEGILHLGGAGMESGVFD